MRTLGRPKAGDCAPEFERYIALVPGEDPLAALEQTLDEALSLFASIPEERAGHRYAPDKWSIRDVAGHLADTERIMGFRALSFARGETAELPGFDEEEYVRASGFDAWTLTELALSFEHARRGHLLFFERLPAEAWDRGGNANGKRITVRAIAWGIAGHTRHHLSVVRERYLAAAPVAS